MMMENRPRCWSADERDTDTPDTVVSSSSPECVLPEAPNRFPGLRLIRSSSGGGDDADDMDSDWGEAPPLLAPRSQSPDIPLCAPIPIRLAPPLVPPSTDPDQNQGLVREQQALKARFGLSPAASFKDASTAANVTVTLTLNASAAEDVTQVTKIVPPPSTNKTLPTSSSILLFSCSYLHYYLLVLLLYYSD